MPAKLTKEQQVAKSKKIHNNFYSYEKFKYINSVTKSWITCPIHGDFEMTMSNHTHKTKPQGCKYCTRLITRDYVVKQSNLKHNNFYNYDLVGENVSSISIIEIICPIHNVFRIRANRHYKGGKGCQQCSKIGAPKLKDSYYIDRLKNFKYPILTELTNIYSTTKLKAFCKDHGEFNITVNHAIENRGCPACGIENKITNFSFSRSGFINICNKKHVKGIFYIIRCFNGDEEFYKVGITSRSVEERYRSREHLPYDYEVVQEIYDNPANIYDLEKIIKKKNKQFKYLPKIKFAGCVSECFKL